MPHVERFRRLSCFSVVSFFLPDTRIVSIYWYCTSPGGITILQAYIYFPARKDSLTLRCTVCGAFSTENNSKTPYGPGAFYTVWMSLTSSVLWIITFYQIPWHGILRSSHTARISLSRMSLELLHVNRLSLYTRFRPLISAVCHCFL